MMMMNDDVTCHDEDDAADDSEVVTHEATDGGAHETRDENPEAEDDRERGEPRCS